MEQLGIGSVPVNVAARVYGKDPSWIRAGIIAGWLLKGVTEGISYSTLAATYDLPCSKDLYYDRFRKFFWLLSKIRG